MEVEENKSIEKLQVKAGEGAAIRDWIKHPGFAIYHAKLKETVEKYEKSMLKGSVEKARICHARAQGLTEALAILIKFQKIGAVAKSEIKKHETEI